MTIETAGTPLITTRQRQQGRLSLSAKLLIGGIGGSMPVLATLFIADTRFVESLLQDISADPNSRLAEANLIGYIVRALGLFLLGAFWAWLHRSETEPLKVFQRGLIAPAMIMTMVNAGNAAKIGERTDVAGTPPAVASVQESVDRVASADGGGTSPTVVTRGLRRSIPDPSPRAEDDDNGGTLECIIDGILGRRC